MGKCTVCGAETNYWYDPCEGGDPMCNELGGFYCGKHFPSKKTADIALQAAIIFMKHAQVFGDERSVAEGKIFTALGIRDPETNRDNAQPFFRNYIQPWVTKEAEAGNLKTGQRWGVKIIANPGNVKVVGTIDGREGPISPASFKDPSQKATDAVAGFKFPPFEFWLSEEQVYP